MYLSKKVRSSVNFVREQISDVDLKSRPKYRPMSFYVLGGVDIDGDSLGLNASTSFDSDEDIEGVDCGVDGTSDPRVSAFDVVEQAGVSAYEKYKTELARSKQTDQPDQPDKQTE